MGRITLEQAAAWCGGRIDPKYKDVTFYGASNDTRNMKGGELFVALQGARDGHEFIPAALEKNAAAVLCNHCDGDYPAIVVEDPRAALGAIARGERNRLGMKVVGVTGSVGKSTTKEMIASILETTYRTGKTPVNHNNDIGMPMAILAMPEQTEVAVLEMGMNHFREMAHLSSIAQPDVAVIVNIGTMHIEHLGSQEGILQAKLEILEGLRPDGEVVLNADDRMLWKVRRVSKPCTWFATMNPEAQVRGSEIRMEGGQTGFHVETADAQFDVSIPVEGNHFVPDALAAITVGLRMGVTPEHIVQGLARFQNMSGRQEMIHTDRFLIIKDCYNAGPESMDAALQVLGNQKGRKIAVLGEMLELGVNAQAEHYRVGRIAAERADYLLAYGPNGSKMVEGAITGGLLGDRSQAFDDRQNLIRTLKRVAKPGDVLLFKGSRGMHMERVLDEFLEEDK